MTNLRTSRGRLGLQCSQIFTSQIGVMLCARPYHPRTILSVSQQSSTWSPSVKTSVVLLQEIVSTLINDYFICIVLGNVVFLCNIVCVAYCFISICDVTHRTSEAGNGEPGPSTLSSLVGNFPCMPQSPAFTHPSLKVLGPRTLSQVSRFPCFSGCPSQSWVAKQHLTITSTFCARLLLPFINYFSVA